MTAPVQATHTDRALSAFRRLVLSVYPAAIYWLTHEYAVVESDGLTFSGQPTDPTFSPALPTQVPYAPALAGSSCIVPVGALAYVAFANGDPCKPFLVRFAQILPSSAIVDASVLTIGPTAGATIGRPTVPTKLVREGDTYTAVGSVPGTVVLTLLTPNVIQLSGPTTAKG